MTLRRLGSADGAAGVALVPVDSLSLRAARLRAARTDFLLLSGMAILTACAASGTDSMGDQGAGAPFGSLGLSSPALGERTLLPTVCHAGERELFLGFDLHDQKAGLVTRLIFDPATGPVVRMRAVR